MKRHIHHWLHAAVVGLCLCIGVAHAADAPGITWSQLTAEQQQILAGFENNWEQLPPGRQVALAKGTTERWLTMTPDQRERASERFSRWQSLTDEQRAQIRERYQNFQDLTPDEQARLRENFRRFRDLSPERRQELRERFRQLTPEQRQRVRERLQNRRPPARRQ
jgi:hypothetical protein